MHRDESPMGRNDCGGIDFTSRYSHEEIEALVREAHIVRSREFARIFRLLGRAAGRFANAFVNAFRGWAHPGRRETLARR